MNTINIAADATAQRIGIGNQYENLATAVVFDCSKFAEDHGAGTAQVIHRRPTESVGYVCTNVSQTNNTVTWLVTDDDTSFTGKGLVQLRWYVNDVLRESVIFPTYILPSVVSSDDAPADVKSALEQIMEWVNDNTISIEDLDERIANYFYDHPLPMEGEADGLVAGTAKQLLSDSYTLDQVPYLFRKSPDSDRAVEEIVGGTVGWNQMIREKEAGTYKGITLSASGTNGTVVVSGTRTDSGYVSSTNWQVPTAANHKYLINASNYTEGSSHTSSSGLVALDLYTQVRNIKTQGAVFVFTKATETTVSFSVGGNVGDVYDYSFIPQIFDLTTMFGSTIADYIYSLEQSTAGAGVAKLKEWGFFTEDYYEYCEPTLRSVEGLQSKVTRDADENIIATYSLDSTLTLRGVPKLDSNNNLYYDGDVYPADGNGSRRYGLVDLGTLMWGANAHATLGTYFYGDIISKGVKYSGSFVSYLTNAVCANYINATRTTSSFLDKCMCFDGNSGQGQITQIQIKDSSYTDAAAFKTAMSGVYLVYELATPTTFTATPYHNPQIVGDTEEWVTTGLVPVGHATKYYQNLRKKIENLPWNFATLIAPTEVTNKATRNYTTGSYLILNNVLYKVTANIANGGTIIVNTNVTATTIMAEIMTL